MLVNWRPKAQESLLQIFEYISNQNSPAALELYEAIKQAVSELPQHPYLYRKGRALGTREIVVHPNYLVVYRVTTNEIQILNVLHARRQYP